MLPPEHMEATDRTVERQGQPYERLCCLLLNWSDASSRKNSQLEELQSVLYQQYGAFINPVVLDQQDLRDTEKSLAYHVENFLRKYDRRENALLIVYSGGGYVHDGGLFLLPHHHAEPSIQWSEYVDRKVLTAAASVVLIFDTTYMRHGHYLRMWDQTCRRREEFYLKRDLDASSPFQLLAVNGSATSVLTSSLSALASTFPDGFAISHLHDAIRNDPECFGDPPPCFYHSEYPLPFFTRLLPLSWPKLQLYQHHILIDPHNEYLKNVDSVPLQEDGACEVFRMRLGVDIQEFWPSPGVVAVKRFTIRSNTRAYLREDFLREKESLVEVSRWRHDHILGMLGTFETECERFSTLNIVLPFAEGGNLHDFLRLERFTGWKHRGYPTSDPSFVGCLKDWRYAVYRQAIGLVDALATLHDRTGKYLVHCDIKPANILIRQGKFKLADFGLSRFKDSDETSKTEWQRGTALYSPPEKDELMGRGRDVWALGCVLLEIAVMIRYAFQIANGKNFADIFESDRRTFSKEAGGDGLPIFHKTMPCVHQVMDSFSRMRVGLRKKIVLDGMTPMIRAMLQEDQTRRITATSAMSNLKEHYITLQADPQLQQDILWGDNPGGPPSSPEAWNSFPGLNQNEILSPSVSSQPLAQSVGPLQRPPSQSHQLPIIPCQSPAVPQPDALMQRTETRPASCPELQMTNSQLTRPLIAEIESTGSVPRLGGLDIHDRKRPLLTEESVSSTKRPTQPGQWPEHYIF